MFLFLHKCCKYRQKLKHKHKQDYLIENNKNKFEISGLNDENYKEENSDWTEEKLLWWSINFNKNKKSKTKKEKIHNNLKSNLNRNNFKLKFNLIL